MSCFPELGRFSFAAGGAAILPLPDLAAAAEGPEPSAATLLALGAAAAGAGPFAATGAALGRPLRAGGSSVVLPRFMPACACSPHTMKQLLKWSHSNFKLTALVSIVGC